MYKETINQFRCSFCQSYVPVDWVRTGKYGASKQSYGTFCSDICRQRMLARSQEELEHCAPEGSQAIMVTQ